MKIIMAYMHCVKGEKYFRLIQYHLCTCSCRRGGEGGRAETNTVRFAVKSDKVRRSLSVLYVIHFIIFVLPCPATPHTKSEESTVSSVMELSFRVIMFVVPSVARFVKVHIILKS